MSRAGPIVAALLLGVACAGPSGPPLGKGGTHLVGRGETLWSISQRYGTTVQAVARANRLSDVTLIRVGQHLIIPSHRTPRVGSGNPWGQSDRRGRSVPTRFGWPVKGTITSRFGERDGAHHDGIDISVPSRTQVHAAEAGRVVHSDNSLAGYGNMIIVKHKGAFSTVYAHNRRNLVKVGAFVEKGQVIAESGQTGRASAPHLHFEIRRDGAPRNPLTYLR